MDDLDQGNPYDYLKRIADCHRVHLFDVVTQYRAIFTDDTSGNEEKYDGGLLYSWAMHRITLHLAVLQALLPKISDGMSLATLLEQCMVIFEVYICEHCFVGLNTARLTEVGQLSNVPCIDVELLTVLRHESWACWHGF